MQKLYFRQVCEKHNIVNTGLEQIALQSGVSKSIVDTMHVGIPIAGADAIKILAALSRITGHLYDLSNVAVSLSDLQGGK